MSYEPNAIRIFKTDENIEITKFEKYAWWAPKYITRDDWDRLKKETHTHHENVFTEENDKAIITYKYTEKTYKGSGPRGFGKIISKKYEFELVDQVYYRQSLSKKKILRGTMSTVFVIAVMKRDEEKKCMIRIWTTCDGSTALFDTYWKDVNENNWMDQLDLRKTDHSRWKRTCTQIADAERIYGTKCTTIDLMKTKIETYVESSKQGTP